MDIFLLCSLSSLYKLHLNKPNMEYNLKRMIPLLSDFRIITETNVRLFFYPASVFDKKNNIFLFCQ